MSSSAGALSSIPSEARQQGAGGAARRCPAVPRCRGHGELPSRCGCPRCGSLSRVEGNADATEYPPSLGYIFQGLLKRALLRGKNKVRLKWTSWLISESVFKDINIFQILVIFITPVLCMRYPYCYYNISLTRRRKVNHQRN